MHFEPWMALSFTEGSIGGDIERINLDQLEAFYSKAPSNPGAQPFSSCNAAAYVHDSDPPEPTGSNGMAIAPSNTANHHALLLINPHTSFFFRSELQMASDQGLERLRSCHLGTVLHLPGLQRTRRLDAHLKWRRRRRRISRNRREKGRHLLLQIRKTKSVRSPSSRSQFPTRPTTAWPKRSSPSTSPITAPSSASKTANGSASASCRSPSRRSPSPTSAPRRKTTNPSAQTLELKANSSNNTIFADADGDIAYFHGNFIPRRDTSFDFTKPVDGSNPATDWKGLLTVDELPQLLNPKSGWLYNSNNWPWSGAGESSLRKQDYPAYVETGTETARGLHAIRVLQNKKDFTLDSLITAAYDSYLPWFDKPIPALIKAWDNAPAPIR